MKALTLTQPWATLIALGEKRLETRGWPAPDFMAGQRLAIHAGSNLVPVGGERGLRELCARPPFRDALFGYGTPYLAASALPRGEVLCIVTVNACVKTETIDFAAPPSWLDPARNEVSFGDYTAGRWAWSLSDLEVLPEPIPARGRQKLWEWKGP